MGAQWEVKAKHAQRELQICERRAAEAEHAAATVQRRLHLSQHKSAVSASNAQ